MREAALVKVDAEAINDLTLSEAADVLLFERSDDVGVIWLKDLAAPLADMDRRTIHLGESSTDLSETGKLAMLQVIGNVFGPGVASAMRGRFQSIRASADPQP